MAIIYFWSPKADYGFLCQWYPSTFTDENNITYNCAEQYMMHQKAILFNDHESANKILAETTPRVIQLLGRKVKNFNAKTWDKYKFEIVKTGNYLKFSQNLDLKQKLLDTGDAILAEASPYDKIWGIGLKESDAIAYPNRVWPGENLLGKALMAVREELSKGVPLKC